MEAHPNCTIRVLLDGPFGGVEMKRIEQCHRHLIIAGGSGAGWLMPMIAAYLRKLEFTEIDNRGCQPSMRVLLATRDGLTRNWFEEKVDTLLESFGVNKSTPGLGLELYFTSSQRNPHLPQAIGQFLQPLNKPKKVMNADVQSLETPPSSVSASERLSTKSVKLHYHEGRPDLPTIIREEAQFTESGKPLGVFVCGPLSMQSDTANAVAKEQIAIMKNGSKDIYLHMEHFSWA